MSILRSAPATQHSEEKTHSGYRYDAYGNTLDNGDSAFIYDDRNRLVEAQDPATQVTTGTYGHNALGQRVIKDTGTDTVLFAYDEAGHLIGEYDDQGNRIREYAWLGDTPITMMDDTDVYYIHSDHLNTPKIVTDDTQTVVWKGDYTPFGEVDEAVSTIEFNLRFPGQFYDAETGLNYNWHRYYDPLTDRYLQSDRMTVAEHFQLWQWTYGLLHQAPPELNSYVYASANPLRYTDPTGEAAGETAAAWWSVVTADAAIPEPSDAAWPKWAAYAVVGAGIGAYALYEMCQDDPEEEERRKNCQALKDSILNTCAGLTGKKKFKCFAAANTAYRQCMGYE